jgi:hypothetical protein
MDTTDKSLLRRARQTLAFLQKEALPGGLILRLSIVAIAGTVACLGLLLGDAQAGRWLPEIENPYCPITTYTLRQRPLRPGGVASVSGTG